MPTYLVTYDLNKETKRPPIVAKFKSFESWARLSESSYAIASDLSPEEVHDVFRPVLDDNDNIYIITLSPLYTGFGPKDVNEWLANNL